MEGGTIEKAAIRPSLVSPDELLGFGAPGRSRTTDEVTKRISLIALRLGPAKPNLLPNVPMPIAPEMVLSFQKNNVYPVCCVNFFERNVTEPGGSV